MAVNLKNVNTNQPRASIFRDVGSASTLSNGSAMDINLDFYQGNLRDNARKHIAEQGFKSIDEFARAHDIDKSTLSRMMNGNREPRLSTLLRVSMALNVSIDELCGVGQPAPKASKSAKKAAAPAKSAPKTAKKAVVKAAVKKAVAKKPVKKAPAKKARR